MKNKKKSQQEEPAIENYYDLKTDKIDELVAALKDDPSADNAEPITTNISEITGEEIKAKPGSKKAEFDPYKIDKLSRVPTWIKALFVKFWFAGCVCYFIMMGIGLTDLDAILLMGVVLGLIVDVLVNPMFRYMQSDRREYDAYMMFPFPFKAFWTFFANIFYYVLVLIVVDFGYLGLNSLINLISGTELQYYVGVEPLLFGVFAVIADMAFIGIKDLIVFLVRRAKRKKAAAAAGEVITPGNSQKSGTIPDGGQSAESAEAEEVSDDEPVDEVERLRRLAERQNAESAKGANLKNKKRK